MIVVDFIKDPDAVLDYRMNWVPWLEPNEIITGSTWVVPAGITKNNDTHDTTSATIWLAGGSNARTYVVTNHITTNGGRTDDRSFRIRVLDR